MKNSKKDDDSKYKRWDKNHPFYKFMHPKGPGFTYDMTPIIDLNVIYHIKVPETGWFTDEEFHQIFIKAYKLTPENIQDMIDYDKKTTCQIDSNHITTALAIMKTD